MLHGLHTLQSKMPTKRELAMKAIEVEQNYIKEAVGSRSTSATLEALNKYYSTKTKQ